jgi:hypothetical protein
MTKIKEEMRADAEKDRRQKFQQFGTMHHALAVITIAVEKYEAAKTVSNYCTEPDTPFKFDPSATGEVEAALREIGRDIYKVSRLPFLDTNALFHSLASPPRSSGR